MPTEPGLPEAPAVSADPQKGAPEGLEAPMLPISRTWVIVGSAALLVGLAMGLIMSTLGK
jgi:hypothetical protein